MPKDEGVELMSYFFGVELDNDMDKCKKLKGTLCIRAYLPFLIGCTIFINNNQQYIDVMYLNYFHDLTTINQWSWSVAALALSYNYL